MSFTINLLDVFAKLQLFSKTISVFKKFLTITGLNLKEKRYLKGKNQKDILACVE